MLSRYHKCYHILRIKPECNVKCKVNFYNGFETRKESMIGSQNYSRLDILQKFKFALPQNSKTTCLSWLIQQLLTESKCQVQQNLTPTTSHKILWHNLFFLKKQAYSPLPGFVPQFLWMILAALIVGRVELRRHIYPLSITIVTRYLLYLKVKQEQQERIIQKKSASSSRSLSLVILDKDAPFFPKTVLFQDISA